MSHLRYRTDIDGLRAVAVIGVVLFHAGFGFPGGYVGVDIFFVISGFLITSLILRDLKTGTFSMFDFWERRARRILPALAVVTAFTLVVGYYLLFPQDYRALGTGIMALAAFSSNIQFWGETGYFAAAADQKPMLHTWSLSVEEQFYLLIPIILCLLWRWGKAHRAFHLLLWGGLASLALAIYGTYRAPSATFFLLPTRTWEIAAGSLLAFAAPVLSWRLRNGMGALGAISILLPFFLYSPVTRFPGLAAIPPVAGAALLIWSGMRSGDPKDGSWKPAITERLLAIRPLVWIGLLSYSLYLWHWPLLAFYRYAGIFQDSVSIRATLLVASLGLACLSLRFVEQPFRSRSLVSKRTSVFALSVATIVALVSPCIFLWHTDGIPQRLSPKARLFAAGAADFAFRDKSLTLSDIPNNLVKLGTPGKESVVFVWGDSHAMAILPAVDAACKELSLSGVAATHNCTPPVLDWFIIKPFGLGADSLPYNRAIFNYLNSSEARKSIKTVILAAKWCWYMDQDLNSLQTAVASTVAALNRCGYQVILLKQVPGWSTDVPKALALREMMGSSRFLPHAQPSITDYYQHRQDLLFARVNTANASVQFIDPQDFLKDATGKFVPGDENGAFFVDTNHISVHGARRLVPAFESLLRAPMAAIVPPTLIESVNSSLESERSLPPMSH
ncbi:MAG: acyltransferase family protein [Luteolibacter sp.]